MEVYRVMKIDKRASIDEIVKDLADGASILIGGWGPVRKPMSLVRAIARSPVKDLTILSLAGMDLDLLIGAGKVKTAVFGFISFEGAPGRPGNFNRARIEGTVEMKELSEYMFIAQLKAAAERLPFYPTRSGLGTDILNINPEIKTITDPYTDQTLVAMPAVTPDYAMIHVNEADEMGNGRILGDPYLDSLFVRAADKVIMSTEKILPVGKIQDHSILGSWVAAVVEAPQGAYPGDCYPDYGITHKEFKRYGDAAKGADSFKEYLGEIIKGG
jgi:glutaconate CoA-transferase subunit A